MIPPKSANVFALSKFAVDVQAVNRIVLVELLHNHPGFCKEFGAVFLGPPVFQIAFVVKLATHVVKAMRHFMPESRTANNGIQNGIIGHLTLVTPEQ